MLCVLVSITGPSRKPDSSIQCTPVNSPAPFKSKAPAKTGSSFVFRPRGTMAVTPVRTGPFPTSSFPSPRMIVLWPTATPATSVIALSGPGAPSNGIPRSRARGRPAAERTAGSARSRARAAAVGRFVMHEV